jgi:Sulfotransferase family
MSTPGAAPVFPFLVGCNRSGTTMLRAMFDSHPDVVVPPESYFVIPALRRADAYEAGGGFDVETFLADVRANPSFRRNWELPAPALTAFRDDPPPDTAAALLRLYGAYAAERGKARAADKTPQHVLHLDLLARSFPRARFVHLVRDGRNVVPSLLEVPHGPTRFPDGVEYWRNRVLAGRRAGDRLGRERYREVRYEDLVADPEPCLGELCEFLELPYTPAMLDYPTRVGELVAGTFDARHHLGISQAPTSTGRDWRTTMTDHDVQQFEAIAGDALDTFGYERSGMSASSRVRAEVALRRVRDAGVSGVRRLRRGPASS